MTYSFCIQCHRECALKWTLCVHNSYNRHADFFSFSMSMHKMPVIYNHFEKVLGNSVSVWLLFKMSFVCDLHSTGLKLVVIYEKEENNFGHRI